MPQLSFPFKTHTRPFACLKLSGGPFHFRLTPRAPLNFGPDYLTSSLSNHSLCSLIPCLMGLLSVFFLCIFLIGEKLVYLERNILHKYGPSQKVRAPSHNFLIGQNLSHFKTFVLIDHLFRILSLQIFVWLAYLAWFKCYLLREAFPTTAFEVCPPLGIWCISDDNRTFECLLCNSFS